MYGHHRSTKCTTWLVCSLLRICKHLTFHSVILSTQPFLSLLFITIIITIIAYPVPWCIELYVILKAWTADSSSQPGLVCHPLAPSLEFEHCCYLGILPNQYLSKNNSIHLSVPVSVFCTVWIHVFVFRPTLTKRGQSVFRLRVCWEIAHLYHSHMTIRLR